MQNLKAFMKKVLILSAIIVFVYLITSCTTNNVVNSSFLQKRKYQKGFYVNSKTLKNREYKYIAESEKPVITENDNYQAGILDDLYASSAGEIIISENKANKYEIYKALVKENPDSCDLIIFRNGEETYAKVLEIGIDDIRYKDCSNQQGPVIVTKKNDVFMIKYPNGAKTVIENQNIQTNNNDTNINETVNTKKKPEIMGLIGYVLGFIGLLTSMYVSMLIGFFFAVMGIFSGSISLARIALNKEKYKGRAFGYVSILFGLINIAITLLMINLVYM